MPNYEQLYFNLFNSVSNAIEQLENHNYGQATDTLKQAQQKTEELYIEAKDEE